MERRADRVSFVPVNSASVDIKKIQISYEKVQPKGVSLAVSSAERATLYYSDRSFIIPEGIVARTYKIEVMSSLEVGNIKRRCSSQGYSCCFRSKGR